MNDNGDYPYEKPLPGNVVHHPARKERDLPVVDILRGAFNADLQEVVIVGRYKDGREFLSTSMSSTPQAIYRLQRGQHVLNLFVDQDERDIHIHDPDATA